MDLVGLGDGNASPPRKPYPTDVSDEEWAFVAPYLTLMTRGRPAAAPRPARGLQRPALDRARRRAVAHAADQLPAVGGGLPADPALDRGRLLRGDGPRPARAAALERRAAPTSPTAVDPRQPHACRSPRRAGTGPATTGTSGARAARSTSPSTPWATCWRCTSPRPTPRTGRRSAALAAAVQEATGETVELAFVDQGYTGEQPAAAAAAHGIRLEVVKLPEAKRGFVLLPRRWVVERSFAWAARFRRLARDYERLPETVAGLAFRRLCLPDAPSIAHRRRAKSITGSSPGRTLLA